MTAFFSALAALPDLIKLFSEVFSFIKQMMGDNPAQFVKDTTAVISQLREAKSPEERSNAAAAIQGLIRRL